MNKKAFTINCHAEFISASHEIPKQVRNDNKRVAFTLAEVLITLTIIGVIAAITIPNLMQSYRKHQVEVGVKEAYSILANAVKISETENGTASEWKYGTNKATLVAFTETNLLPYLKIGKNCGYKAIEGTTNCFSKVTDLAGNNESKAGYSLILANGMSIFVYMPWTNNAKILIDIDGPAKGSGVLGKDIFVYSIANLDTKPDFKVTFSPGAVDESNSGTGANPYISKKLSELLTTVNGACSTTKTGNMTAGYQCAAAIAKNGWKIPDNYPVKKF